LIEAAPLGMLLLHVVCVLHDPSFDQACLFMLLKALKCICFLSTICTHYHTFWLMCLFSSFLVLRLIHFSCSREGADLFASLIYPTRNCNHVVLFSPYVLMQNTVHCYDAFSFLCFFVAWGNYCDSLVKGAWFLVFCQSTYF
jgi:hypothetical protein